MKINLTPIQLIALTLVVLGAISGGTAQLTTIFGATITQTLVAISALATSILSGWIMILTGQSGLVKSVQEMPGVDRIVVNEKANVSLATMAVDPAQDKIEASPASANAVAQTAKGV